MTYKIGGTTRLCNVILFLKRILLILLISCLVFMTACSPLERVIEFFSDDGTGYIFKISLPDDPEILDPQIATDESSIAILKNMFVGLLKQDSDGTISTQERVTTLSHLMVLFTLFILMRDTNGKLQAIGKGTLRHMIMSMLSGGFLTKRPVRHTPKITSRFSTPKLPITVKLSFLK